MRPHNYVEDVVFEVTDRLAAADSEFCGCEKCCADVAAYALAHLRPQYAAGDVGRAVTRVVLGREDHHAEVTVKVAQAIGMVKGRPRH